MRLFGARPASIVAGVIGISVGLVRAKDAEAHARREAAALAKVSQFLADMLASVDAQQVGRLLLSDLELVLAQIVQLRAGDPDDVEIIDEGLESSQLLFRLKAARASAPATVGL